MIRKRQLVMAELDATQPRLRQIILNIEVMNVTIQRLKLSIHYLSGRGTLLGPGRIGYCPVC